MSELEFFVVIGLSESVKDYFLQHTKSNDKSSQLARTIASYGGRIIRGSEVEVERGVWLITICCSDYKEAVALVEAVRRLEGVQAAYVKPPDQLP